jgi:hypothetical protein
MLRIMSTSALILLCTVGTAPAQGRFAMELRGGAAFPDQTNLDGAKPNTGAGLGLTARVRALPMLHIYAGWEWHRFSFDEPIEADLDDTGYALGAQFQQPFAPKLDFWLRGGAIYNHIEIESDQGSIADSGHELGWELGGGVAYAIAPNIALTPGIRYRALPAEVDLKGPEPYPVDHSYFLAELGISWSFGRAPAVVAARTR